MNAPRTAHSTALRGRCRRFGGRFVKTMMSPAPMSLFDLLKFLALFVSKIGSHLPMRLSDGLMYAPAGLSSNVSELRCRFVDDRRNLGDLLRCQVRSEEHTSELQ